MQLNITRIQDLRHSTSSSYAPLNVKYKRNFVKFVSTADQEAKLKFKLQATGLAVEVQPFQQSDIEHEDNVNESPQIEPASDTQKQYAAIELHPQV